MRFGEEDLSDDEISEGDVCSLEQEQQIAMDTLERYSGSSVDLFQPYVLLTNFPKYVQYFAEIKKVTIHEGSMFKVAHCPDEKITMLDFKIGSPAAALVVDLISFLPVRACLLLGMCGGLRRHYEIGDYVVPIAAIRGEATSDFYFPPEVPAMANFLIQKGVSDVLDDEKIRYYVGITHTTNKRFWEFNKSFRKRIMTTRPQAIEMECATLFTGSYSHRLPLGALLLVSDLPLDAKKIKTKKMSDQIYREHTSVHVDLGVKIFKHIDKLIDSQARGVFRGCRKRFNEE